jgi:hypothetical protein
MILDQVIARNGVRRPRLRRALCNALPTLVLAVALAGPAAPVAANGPGLAVMMERMQTYTHKLQLSLAAGNARLADLYIHELEESAEYIIDHLPRYHDYPVGELTREMLLPAIEALEDAVDSGDWAESGARFTQLLDQCNACHTATGKAYIRMVPAAGNPFLQDFSVVED